jgi:hypothetical protein
MLTIQEASQLTGKSEKTIRRLIKHLLQTNKNAKSKIQQVPFPGGFTYRIDEEYLKNQFQSSPNMATLKSTPRLPQDGQEATPPEQENVNLVKSKDETIAVLKTENDRLHQTIRELLERDKERNILFHKFQDALMLEAPNHRVDTNKLDTQVLDNQTVHNGRQDGQPKERILDIKEEQPETAKERGEQKLNRKHPQKVTKQSRKPEKEQIKKRFFSFFRAK